MSTSSHHLSLMCTLVCIATRDNWEDGCLCCHLRCYLRGRTTWIWDYCQEFDCTQTCWNGPICSENHSVMLRTLISVSSRCCDKCDACNKGFMVICVCLGGGLRFLCRSLCNYPLTDVDCWWWTMNSIFRFLWKNKSFFWIFIPANLPSACCELMRCIAHPPPHPSRSCWLRITWYLSPAQKRNSLCITDDGLSQLRVRDSAGLQHCFQSVNWPSVVVPWCSAAVIFFFFRGNREHLIQDRKHKEYIQWHGWLI